MATKLFTLCMATSGPRKLADLLKVRELIVELHKQGGLTRREIARQAKVSEPTVRATLKLHAERRDTGLAPAARGWSTDKGRLLSPDQELRIRSMLMQQSPEAFMLPGPTWTRQTVLELVNRVMARGRGPSKGPMSSRTLGNYLKRWGLTAGGAAMPADMSPSHTHLPPGATRQMVLWELLGWAPAASAQVMKLAQALCHSDWDGQLLFVGLSAPWSFQREVSRLRERFEAHATRQARTTRGPDPIASMTEQGDLINQHWKSATRTNRLAGITLSSVDTRPLSLRIFPVSMVMVSHTRTKKRHVGPTAVDEQVTPGLFVGILDVRSGAFEARLLRVNPEAGDGVLSKDLELRRFLSGFVAKRGRAPCLHLPTDFELHDHYHLAMSCAKRLGLPVVADMLPSYFAPNAHAAVDVLKLSLRGSAKKGTSASLPSVAGQVWHEEKTLDTPMRASGPIPGRVGNDMARSNRKGRPAEGNKDKA